MYACNEKSKKAIKKYMKSKIELLEKTQPLDWATWTPEYFNPPVFKA